LGPCGTVSWLLPAFEHTLTS